MLWSGTQANYKKDESFCILCENTDNDNKIEDEIHFLVGCNRFKSVKLRDWEVHFLPPGAS